MRKLALLVAFVSVVVLALAAVARAVPPEHSVVNIDDDFTIPAGPGTCSFPIQGHVTGNIRTTTFFDKAGNVIREISVFPQARVTFSANGKSISTVTPSVERFTFNPDGSATLTITGLSGHLITGGGLRRQSTSAGSYSSSAVLPTRNPTLSSRRGSSTMDRSRSSATF